MKILYVQCIGFGPLYFDPGTRRSVAFDDGIPAALTMHPDWKPDELMSEIEVNPVGYRLLLMAGRKRDRELAKRTLEMFFNNYQ